MNQKEETSLQENHILLPLLCFSGLSHYFFSLIVLFASRMLKQQHGMVSTGCISRASFSPRRIGWASVPVPTEQWILFCVQEGNCTWQHCSFSPKCWFHVHVKIPYSVCCFQVLHCTHLWCWDGFACVSLPPGPGSWCSPAQWSIYVTSVPANVQICVFHYLECCFAVLCLLFPTELTSGGSHSSRALLSIAHIDCFVLKSSRA